MKLALLGGAGTRVPLVLVGLMRSHKDLPIDEVVLWDVDAERQALINRICAGMIERYGVRIKFRSGKSPEDALEGSDFIISGVRVGGSRTRVLDEQIALSHGVLGQETIGPGGWAMALRTIPIVLRYAQLAERIAPQAWFLNFSNPVGIVLQAVLAAGVKRTIGICDTPRELFESIAGLLGTPSKEIFFDYVGLNHLGWVKSVQVKGRDRLGELLDDPERLAHVYHLPLFTNDYLRQLKLLPTEYVYFYCNAARAVDQLKQAANTRGQTVLEQEEKMFREVAAAGTDGHRIVEAYDNFLASRDATYFQLETGAKVDQSKIDAARHELYNKAAGYERIAVDVMHAIAANQPAVFPVDVANHGALDELEALDAVEAPCVIDANGARALAVGAVPAQVRSLLLQVKEYERLTARAALEGSARLASNALAANPLVNDRRLADELTSEYLGAHKDYLAYLK